MSARVVRDTDVTEDAKKGIEGALDSIKKGFEDTFSKDNLDVICISLIIFYFFACELIKLN